MKRKTLVILSSSILAAALATAFVIIHKPLPRPEPIKPPRVYLNDTLTNSLSDIPEVAGLDKKVKSFMREWQIKGASLAIMRNDSLIYAKGYGWADEEEEIPMEPSHILRMASVSKLITATGIMVLQDRDSLSIKDTVFGPSGILNDSLFNSIIKDRNHHKITVEHLLRHQGGFYRDPLFSSRDVMHQMQLETPPVKEDFYRLVLRHNLRFMPGEWQKYSNFGYLLLSEIIEKVSGKPYEQFIKEDVLRPAGCFDMHIAGSYYSDRRENEVRYYTHEGEGKYIEEYTDSGIMVERCYGGNNIPLLSGAGAWCGSPAEIARLVASIDGRPETTDILSAKAVAQMTEYFDKDTYSLGWNDTDPSKGWSRTGTLAGTSALVKYFPDGECWILITNTSTWRGPGLARFTDNLFRQCRELYSEKLPRRNLFE
ncbi:MAG: beta-lactamase family protein [Bacteroidales bacterium]|nr:beta-lactamase family protein [Bacteroidales bacterium]MBQ8810963.1 beta-lactamase family protein [Bacteroidales bacterium]